MKIRETMSTYENQIAYERNQWAERMKRKANFEIQKKLDNEMASQKPCPLCEERRRERVRREEKEKRVWYNSLTKIQQILAKNRGDVPSYF